MVTVKRKLNVSIASRGRIEIRPIDPNAETLHSKGKNEIRWIAIEVNDFG